MKTVKGLLTLFLFCISLLFNAFLVIFSALFLFVIPTKRWKKAYQLHYLQRLPELFDFCNTQIMRISTTGHWDIAGTGALKQDGWYLLVSNHRSWIDIVVLGKAFSRKIPPLKFFMKKELLWQLPFAGLACYALGYPFMSRHSHAEIKKNPALKGKDVATTKKACEKLKDLPSTMVNFAEGTRFTKHKKERQDSPFQHLLKPRAGGAAVVLQELHQTMTGILNVTIVYAPKMPNFWEFCCGNFGKIIVRYEVLPVTENLIGDYENDRNFRPQLQQWFNEIWERNDHLIDRQLRENS